MEHRRGNAAEHAEPGRKSSGSGGKLGVMLVGVGGAVATTFMAGIELVRRGFGEPVGSLSQLGRLVVEGEKRERIKDLLPLASVEDLVFGGWDVFGEDCYEAAVGAGVLSKEHLGVVREALKEVEVLRGVFDGRFVSSLEGDYTKEGEYGSLKEAVSLIREDIRSFRERSGVERVVMINCASTEAYVDSEAARRVHGSVEDFERALEEKRHHPAIPPSVLYAYAAIEEGVPYANGTPSLGAESGALKELAESRGVALCGKDFKSGQTFIKSALAPAIKARMLGMEGWFSTNILGNRDGLVLEEPANFKSKEITKRSVLDAILEPEVYGELYGELHHRVEINYYPPRGDAKEGWDNIDIFGWLGYPMQIKVNFLARDSILAAPMVLDLVLFLDLAQREGLGGVQRWLSFYFKSPMEEEGGRVEHDLFVQLLMLRERLREMAGLGPLCDPSSLR
ncbi:myo-inositol-1-phosphate synthase [Rubrobacter xylanophilus]|uniref:Myo-inositol-1-phosphate synthase n=1 Tax=Rubrobacter xylanophilus TaxID=49319 RepID=A0A510HQC0_9ACTN|nr:inositol-3-phosphate synthase [Rubrobacter xylanophilus]BBL81177.1 myo-inositol-1-phosphate synthase [Rubrobacter xylanophilus]